MTFLFAVIAVGVVDGLTQATRGWRAVAVLAAATTVVLAAGHGVALEIGLRGYVGPLLEDQAVDTAVALGAWALIVLLAQSSSPRSHPATRAAAAGALWLPSPVWLFAVALAQALLYQSVDGLPYGLLAGGLALICLAALATVALRASRASAAQPQGLARPFAALIVLALSVGLTAAATPAPIVPLPIAGNSLIAIALVAMGLATLGALRRRRWL